MENEKSDIKKGWVTGSIDLGKLNKAHQRFSFNELNPKTLNKFKKDLRVLLDDDFIPRTLDVFQTHPLLRFIIPVLKGKLQTDYLSMELFIEMALLLSEYPLLVDKDLISHINTSIYDDYEDVWKSIIKLKDCGLLNELTIILRKYSEYKGSVQKAEKDSFECLSLISKKELFAITYKELHINEAIYENRVCCYFYSFKLGSLILYPFVDTYCKAFVEEEHPSQRLYNELCVKGDVAKVMTASGKISREAVLERIHLPIALCYIIALDKLTASEVVSDKWILNNVSSQYVNAFHLLWWECSFHAAHKEKYMNKDYADKPFQDQIEYVQNCIELSTGERPNMPDGYFLQNTVEVIEYQSNENNIVDEGSDIDGITNEISTTCGINCGKKTKKFDSSEEMKKLIQGVDEEQFLSVLHKNIDGKGGKDVAIVLQKAFDEKRLLKIPSEKIIMSEFEITKTWEATRKYLDSRIPMDKNLEIHELAERYEYK